MPSLPKSILLSCCFFLTIFFFRITTTGANIATDYQNKPFVISTPESYKNTTLLDSNQLMVPLDSFLSSFYVDFKYATPTNFTGKILYDNPAPYLRLPAAKALQKAVMLLKDKGLTLKIFDAYRPYAVTKAMWQIVPDARYAANPANGSGHNRGAAVDVTLAYLATGKELEMPTGFDDFSEKAHHDYSALSARVLQNRALLKSVMEQAGFVALRTEWWHYSLPDAAKNFALLDLDFDQLKALGRP